MKPFDTDKTPWLFTPHGEGELNEYFTADHSKAIAETSRCIIDSLSESRDRLSGEVCYHFNFNHRRYKLTLLRFVDIIVRADVTAKKLKSRIMELDIENRELRKQLADMERKIHDEHTAV